MEISDELYAVFPNFKVGVIEYDQIKISESPQMLRGKLQTFQESLYFDMEEKSVTTFPGIKEWREIFKKGGKDPNRYRPSQEALYRRIKKQKFLPSVNGAIDLNNFFSLLHEIPMGIYDKDKILGSIKMTIGKEEEKYEGLNGRINNLHRLIVTKDESGPFGSPFVDSKRTAISKETTKAIQIVYLRHSLEKEEGEKLTKSLMDMFLHIHGGTGKFKVIG